MPANTTLAAQRLHIGFFGMRNAGKSSLVNAVTGQDLSVVSPVKGTTTDPVRKTMELLPLGPVVILDTPGLDDEGDLGALRVKKARRALNQCDLAVLVVDATAGPGPQEETLQLELQRRSLPYVLAYNKADLLTNRPPLGENALYVSAATGEGIDALKARLAALVPPRTEKHLVKDLLSPGDVVVLVTPIDEAAPKGRLILPQQMTLRDILDAHATAVVCQVEQLAQTLQTLATPPRMVITDSQAFGAVAAIVPAEVPLTSFSILMARFKGDLRAMVQGAGALGSLQTGDEVLICEGCTHHRQCNDIGTVKMPGWIEAYAGAQPQYTFTGGGDFPDDLQRQKLIVHCGGCMLNDAEMQHRMALAREAGVPMVNYGVAIAAMHGILRRSLQLFPDLLPLLED